MTEFPSPESLMLVAIMPSPRDMEIARLLGWYRIPLRSAPKVVDVDYLAFYQTDAFGVEHRWQVEWFAPVRGHELTTRGQLLRDQQQHPRAHEEYYKIQVGSLQQLPRPIPADRWKRLTFLYTTGELFIKAKKLNDLVIGAEERPVFWRSLRERAAQADLYRTTGQPEDDLSLDPELLRFLSLMGDAAAPTYDEPQA